MTYFEEDTPITFRKFTKKIFNGTEWEDKIFYETRKDVNTATRWLQEKYGEGCYCQKWWATYSAVCMSETVYTHYALSV
jgi:hypothetical protein